MEISPELIDARTAAKLCGISRSGFYKLNATGKCPRPIKVGRLSKWRLPEILRWIENGCPPRQRWETMFNSKNGKR